MFEENDSTEDAGTDHEGQEELIEEIKSDPSCEIYGISRISQNALRTVSATVLILCTIIFLKSIGIPDLLFGVIALVIVPSVLLVTVLFYSYFNHAHKYFKTYLSERGIAKDAEGYSGAILWDDLEYVDVKMKGSKVVYLAFRFGETALGYRSSYFARLITLETIAKFFDEFSTWSSVSDFEEHIDADVIYVRPEIMARDSDLKGLDEVHLREYIGDQDYEAYRTEEHPGVKSDQELFLLIENDPQRVVFHDTGRLSKFLGKGKVMYTFVILSIAILLFGYFTAHGTDAIILMIISVLLFIPPSYSCLRWYEKLVMSPIGVGRFCLGSPEAIEWQYVEKVDLYFEDGELEQVEFFGNKQRVFCPQHIYKDRIKIEDIKRYLPNIEDWELVKKKSWGDEKVRYVRPI